MQMQRPSHGMAFAFGSRAMRSRLCRLSLLGVVSGSGAAVEPASTVCIEGSGSISLDGPSYQPRGPVVGEVAPGPLDHDDDAIAESDQKKDVDEEPRKPGEKSGDVHLAKVGDRGRTPNGGEAALVEIMEWLARRCQPNRQQSAWPPSVPAAWPRGPRREAVCPRPA